MDPHTVYLRDILLDVARATNHTYDYVANDMPWRTMWLVYASIQRKRQALAEAARDNPAAMMAYLLSYQ